MGRPLRGLPIAFATIAAQKRTCDLSFIGFLNESESALGPKRLSTCELVAGRIYRTNFRITW